MDERVKDELKDLCFIKANNPINVIFHGENNEELGRFFEQDGELCFEGSVSESAKVFIDFLKRSWHE